MIISVTTVKDTLENVEKFVRRNLLGGIDHLVVFVDAPLPDVESFLADHPDVTSVPAYAEWWGEMPAEALNSRQMTNAALLSQLVVGFPWAEWVFPLDGDEIGQLDRTALAALDGEVRSVQLRPLEAASRLHAHDDPRLFKRRLDSDELQLLHTLGVIEKPRPRHYFRGHMGGKPGLRPSADLALAVHHVIDVRTGDRVKSLVDPAIGRMLHYESHNGDEFVRKWLALLGSGRRVQQHQRRAPLAAAVAALIELGLSEDETRHFLEQLFVRNRLDDIETLSRLGLLVEVDPDAGERGPRPPESDIAELRELLIRAYDAPKPVFRPRKQGPRTARVVARLQAGLL
jgi:hypothetical protein